MNIFAWYPAWSLCEAYRLLHLRWESDGPFALSLSAVAGSRHCWLGSLVHWSCISAGCQLFDRQSVEAVRSFLVDASTQTFIKIPFGVSAVDRTHLIIGSFCESGAPVFEQPIQLDDCIGTIKYPFVSQLQRRICCGWLCVCARPGISGCQPIMKICSQLFSSNTAPVPAEVALRVTVWRSILSQLPVHFCAF